MSQTYMETIKQIKRGDDFMNVMMYLNTQQENEIKVNHHLKREDMDMEEFYNLIVRNLRGEVSIIMTREQIKKMREVLNSVDL